MVRILARRQAIDMTHHLMVPAGGQHHKATQDACQGHEAQGGAHQVSFAEFQY